RKPFDSKEHKPFERKDRKPLGEKERKPYGLRDDKKGVAHGEMRRYEKRERPTLSTNNNIEERMPKKTTAGSRTRTRKNNNENK
ncbi:MAG: hypothetical protein J6L03_04515, partial [Bacteroidaceae bacterium]|nr:hypothetical protein [Bacteroidaceae bacterium]